MPRARKSLISLDDTTYYHCICRCVRRAFLWGTDHFSGKDYSHRKQWVVERLNELTGIFAIEIFAYAVMSNHYHVVLHVDKAKAQAWTTDDVIQRWTSLFGLPTMVAAYQRGQCTSDVQARQAQALIETWRTRLYDISWFMRCLNEHLARRANAEDQCTGRFWEGRFKSQALLDEAGLLTCMAYVDLNPIRAGIADTPEASDFTAIQQRIQALNTKQATAIPLRAFHTPHVADDTQTIPFTLTDYLELVDWTGRAVRDGKRGTIAEHIPPILHRLNIDPDHWQAHMQPHGNLFGRAIGRIDALRLHAEHVGQRWCQGLTHSARLFPT